MIMDADPVDQAKFVPIVRWIQAHFVEDDTGRLFDGKTSLVLGWSASGMTDSVATVTSSCIEHPHDTLAARTDAVYVALSNLQNTMLGRP